MDIKGHRLLGSQLAKSLVGSLVARARALTLSKSPMSMCTMTLLVARVVTWRMFVMPRGFITKHALLWILNAQGMVSINRTHEILSGCFGIPISTGTISNMLCEAASAVAPTVEKIKAALIREDVVNFDETGMPVNGENFWCHVAATHKLTHISVSQKRGQDGMNEAGILPNFTGKAIHDCFSSYFTYNNMTHGLCNAHLLRELTGITENYKQAWPDQMAELLLALKDRKEELQSQGANMAHPLK